MITTLFDYIYLHPNGNYYFRRALPTRLWHKTKKSDFTYSLKTRDLSTALILRKEFSKKYFHYIEMLTNAPDSTLKSQALYLKSKKNCLSKNSYDQAVDALVSQVVIRVSNHISAMNIVGATTPSAMKNVLVASEELKEDKETLEILNDDFMLSAAIEEFIACYSDEKTGAGYRNVADKKLILRHFLAKCGDISVRSMTKEHVTLFIDFISTVKKPNGEEAAPSTKEKKYIDFKLFIKFIEKKTEGVVDLVRYAEKKNTLKTKKARENSGKRADQRAWKDSELDVLFRSLLGKAINKPQNKKQLSDKNTAQFAMFSIIALYTGMRMSEIGLIEKHDINWKDKYIDVPEAKSEAGVRKVPIHAKLESILKALCVIEHKDAYIIPNVQYKKEHRVGYVSRECSKLKTKLGHDHTINFHSLRRSLVTKLKQADVDKDKIKPIVGHERSDITLDVYGDEYTPQQLQNTINRAKFELNTDCFNKLVDFSLNVFNNSRRLVS